MHEQICDALSNVVRREKLSMNPSTLQSISELCNRNARRAVLMLEAATIEGTSTGGAASSDPVIPVTDWELYIRQLASDISKDQSPQRLMAAREKLYELIVSCIPPQLILKTLAQELIKSLDDFLKLEVLEYAAFYEHRLSHGGKEIFHLEAFVAKFMAIYKRYLNELFG